MYGLQFQAEQKSIHFGRAFLPTQFFTRCLAVFFLPRFTHFFIHISFNNKIIMVLY